MIVFLWFFNRYRHPRWSPACSGGLFRWCFGFYRHRSVIAEKKSFRSLSTSAETQDSAGQKSRLKLAWHVTLSEVTSFCIPDGSQPVQRAFPVCSGGAAGLYRHPSVILKEIIPIPVAFGKEPRLCWPVKGKNTRKRWGIRGFCSLFLYHWFLKTGSASGLRSNRVHLTNPPQISWGRRQLQLSDKY